MKHTKLDRLSQYACSLGVSSGRIYTIWRTLRLEELPQVALIDLSLRPIVPLSC